MHSYEKRQVISEVNSHRYQVEARQARLLAEARRDRIRTGLARSIGVRLMLNGRRERYV